ncbi:relA-associated inhibitor isoform X2 [Ambystoma mexicanum]
MAGEQMHGAQSMMDINFQSFATQNIDQKQMELDMAAAKMDTLTKELESIWSDNTPQTPSPSSAKDSRYTVGPLGSQDQLGKWSSSTTPTLSPSLSQPANRKLLSSNGDENYVPPMTRPGSTSMSFSTPLSPYNPPINSSGQLSPLANKNTMARSVSPRPRMYLEPKPLVDRPQSPRPMGISPNYESLTYSQPGRASSPRPMSMHAPPQMRPVVPSDHSASLRPAQGGQYDYLPFAGQMGRVASPRPLDSPNMPQAFFGERMSVPRPTGTPGYESPQIFGSALNVGSSAFAPFHSTEDQAAMRRRSQKSWNESDLDVAYEKKHSQQPSHERGVDHTATFRAPGVPMSGPWRESSLDATPVSSKDDLYVQNTISTLPRNYKYNPSTSDRRVDPNAAWRSHPGAVPGTLPRNWQAAPQQQPISRIPIPPSSPQGGLPKQQRPIPLSMIFKLQNAFWEQRNPYPVGNLQGPPMAGKQQHPQLQHQGFQASSPAQSPVRSRSDGNGKASTLERAQEQHRMPPTIPETGELEQELSILLPMNDLSQVEEVPRPLSPTRLQPILPPEAEKMPEMDEVRRVLADIPRPLKRRGSMEQSVAVPQPSNKKQYQQIMSRLFRRSQPKETLTTVGEGAPQTEMPIIIEGSDTKVGATIAQERSPSPPSPAASVSPSTPISTTPSPEIRSVLKKPSSPKKTCARRARLNPLVLLLDAALTGELDVVQQAAKEMSDPSLANDEGITALHNAICGANYEIVDFLIGIGVNVNSPDSHGWTPLHCAASCNDTDICMALVKHGAAIFAMTFSDGTMAVEKCDPYRDGYKECSSYLSGVEQSMGLVNNGIVYALWDHLTEESDELCFRQGDTVTILRRDDQEEPEWWWASLYGREGYVPRNYFGLFPRVRAHRNS